jgi:predicted O-methyltransferase YrrM
VNSILHAIVRELDDHAGIEPILLNGAVHPGGPHFRVKGTLGPISIGADECRVLATFVEAVRPRRCFIIGNAFGLSSVLIAKLMESNGGLSVETLDNQSEGDGERLAGIADALRRRLQCRLLVNHKGRSPEDVPAIAGGDKYDFILIDGLHRHPQVTHDFLGVLPIASEDAVLWWHDYWMPGIPQSVDKAMNEGMRCRKVNCSCEMVFGTRSEELFERMVALYENTEAPRKRMRPRAFLKLCYALGAGAVKTRMSRERPRSIS